MSSYASDQQSSRVKKAEKIAAVIAKRKPILNADVLDVGTGSGFIASHFVTLVGDKGSVASSDVQDQRATTDGVRFVLSVDGRLPFPDQSFDIVICNHVLEHVGDSASQKAHLSELMRVLRSGGVCYLATPNKWAIIEPHLKLPFLSWIPRSLTAPYVRAAGKGRQYDCWPKSRSEIASFIESLGIAHEEVTAELLSLYLQNEVHGLGKLAAQLPAGALNALSSVWFMPTFAFILSRK